MLGNGDLPGSAAAGASGVPTASWRQEIWHPSSQGSAPRLLRPPWQRPSACTAGRSAAADPRSQHSPRVHAQSLEAAATAGLPEAARGSFVSSGAVSQLAPAAGDSALEAAACSGAAAASGAGEGEALRRHQLERLLAPVEGGEYPEDADAPTGEPRCTCWLLRSVKLMPGVHEQVPACCLHV